jgi:hypothetical protein
MMFAKPIDPLVSPVPGDHGVRSHYHGTLLTRLLFSFDVVMYETKYNAASCLTHDMREG